ncbi:MAG: DUF4038 domain-containing protein [Bacteroidetes bacterium]|nr:DUF4038 domain-containing protein [Bacteroidota bacterium]
MTKYVLILSLCLACTLTHAQGSWQHGQLKVTPDGHMLQYTDGTPFFWLGDTGWELFHRLTLEEIKTYLDNRAAKGFNLIQAVALAEFDGLKRPNRYGQVPFQQLDPTKPNEQYFSIIDSTLKMALERNMFIGLLPTWGDKVTPGWGEGPVVFDSSNAYTYGKWIGQRYRKFPNIVWILGGDRPARKGSADWTPIWRQMAKGIIDGTDHHCILAYHPGGGSYSTSQFIQGESWLNINMFQSGHGSGHDVPCWQLVYRDRSLLPIRPTLDAEPNYEDHPVNPWPTWDPANGYFNDYDVRKQCYRSVFAGACGVTYGHHAIWQFYSPREEKINHADRYWTEAIDRPGAFQVGYLRQLIEKWRAWNRVPDTTMIENGQGEKGTYCTAFKTPDSSLIMVYMPVGKTITLKTLQPGSIKITWFNPRDNSYHEEKTRKSAKSMSFTAPQPGIGKDWVLILSRITS